MKSLNSTISHSVKPCPFCGGPATVRTPSRRNYWGIYTVRCDARCTDGVGPVLLNAWNHRPRIEGGRRAVDRVRQLEGLLRKTHADNVALVAECQRMGRELEAAKEAIAHMEGKS